MALLATVSLIGCSKEPGPRTIGLEEARMHQREGRPAAAASTIRGLCCPDPATSDARYVGSSDKSAACAELVQLIQTSTMPGVVENAVSDWAPGCYAAVPDSALFAALDHPLALWDRRTVIRRLGMVAPSESIAERLVLELRKGGESGDEFRATTWGALASMGEVELAPLVRALGDADPDVREIGAMAMLAVADGPLDMPEALAALEHASSDQDPEVSAAAGAALDKLRLRQQETVDDAVRRLVDARRVDLLSRRRRFCGVPAVTTALERFRTDHALGWTAEADLAIAVRARRCPPVDD